MKTLTVALRVTLFTLLLTGIVYPLMVTALARTFFPRAAAGSLVTDDKEQVVGSELIAQPFTKAAYFQPRPSAAGQNGYDTMASSGSNYGPTSKKLRDRIAADLARLRKENPDAPAAVPDELVTASASGLDPHLSPSAIAWQLPRVAKARAIAPDRIHALVDALTEGRDLGVLGEPRVNVLRLNLALDHRFGAPAP